MVHQSLFNCPTRLFCNTLYLHERTANGNGRSSEQAQYETAWQRATTMQNDMVSLLCSDEYIVHTDGVIELYMSNLLRGTTNLIALPTTHKEVAEGT